MSSKATFLSQRKEIGRAKAQVLNAMKSYQIAQRRRATIGGADLVEFANHLATKVQPQTVSNYLSHPAAIFAIACPAWGYPLDQTAMKDAFIVARRLGSQARVARESAARRWRSWIS
jgi:hypothetical protein